VKTSGRKHNSFLAPLASRPTPGLLARLTVFYTVVRFSGVVRDSAYPSLLAGVAQWQSSGFVNRRLEVQFLSPAPIKQYVRLVYRGRVRSKLNQGSNQGNRSSRPCRTAPHTKGPAPGEDWPRVPTGFTTLFLQRDSLITCASATPTAASAADQPTSPSVPLVLRATIPWILQLKRDSVTIPADVLSPCCGSPMRFS